MQLPSDESSNTIRNLSVSIVILLGWLILILYSVFSGHISTELGEILISTGAIIATLLFVLATLYSIEQNKKSIDTIEKREYRDVVEEIILKIIRPTAVSLDKNADKIEDLDISDESKLLSVKVDEVDLDIIDVARTVEPNSENKYRVNNSKNDNPTIKQLEPLYFDLFESRYKYEADEIIEYGNKISELEEICGENIREMEKTVEEWFLNLDECKFEEEIDSVDLLDDYIRLEEIIEASSYSKEYVSRTMARKCVFKKLGFDYQVSDRLRDVEIFCHKYFDTIEVLFEREHKKDIENFESMQNSLLKETENLHNKLITAEKELADEFKISI